MIYENDFILRQIKNIMDFLRRLLKKEEEYKFPSSMEERRYEELNRKIFKLLEENKINQAEDILFKNMDSGIEKYLFLGLNFYEQINNKTDRELESANFKRDEIVEGLNDMMREFEIKNIYKVK